MARDDDPPGMRRSGAFWGSHERLADESQDVRPGAAFIRQPEPESELDARAFELDAEDEPQFLRGQRRVAVRRGPIPKKTVIRLKQAAVLFLLLAAFAVPAAALYRYATGSWRFRIDSSDNIEVMGAQNVSRAQVMEVLGGDLGRNVFFIPLSERRKQLEQIPWVESAAVMRLLPNRLRVKVQERTPVAFLRLRSKIFLIDLNGVLMEVPLRPAPGSHPSEPRTFGAAWLGSPGPRQYSFPVIVGMAENEPLSTRAARMKIYAGLVRDLDSENAPAPEATPKSSASAPGSGAQGAHYSQDLSEVDLSDPEDVKVTVADPSGAVLVHLGTADFLRRYKIYMAHAQEWRQQFNKLDSVDLRYDRQIIVNPE